jgi:hypothetical protein
VIAASPPNEMARTVGLVIRLTAIPMHKSPAWIGEARRDWTTMPPERVRKIGKPCGNRRNCKAIRRRTVFLARFCYSRERRGEQSPMSGLTSADVWGNGPRLQAVDRPGPLGQQKFAFPHIWKDPPRRLCIAAGMLFYRGSLCQLQRTARAAGPNATARPRDGRSRGTPRASGSPGQHARSPHAPESPPVFG